WHSVAPPSWRLLFISAERFPLTRAQLERALAAWPALRPLSDALLAQYPPRVRGCHRRELAPNVSLQLLLDDAAAGFAAQCDAQGCIDAWFLDGFAPAKNPGMWTPALFNAIARLSRAGATF